MKKLIRLITIRPSILTQQSAQIINSLDVLKRNGIILKQGTLANKQPYVAIRCKLDISKKKGNELKIKLKGLLNAAFVDFELTEI